MADPTVPSPNGYPTSADFHTAYNTYRDHGYGPLDSCPICD